METTPLGVTKNETDANKLEVHSKVNININNRGSKSNELVDGIPNYVLVVIIPCVLLVLVICTFLYIRDMYAA